MERYIVSFLVGLTTFMLLNEYVDFNLWIGYDLDLLLSLTFGAIVAFAVYSGLGE